MALSEQQKTDEALEAIERFIENAMPVPLTNQVRFNPKELQPLLEDLRAALAAERKGW
jgi:hypothetical protein